MPWSRAYRFPLETIRADGGNEELEGAQEDAVSADSEGALLMIYLSYCCQLCVMNDDLVPWSALTMLKHLQALRSLATILSAVSTLKYDKENPGLLISAHFSVYWLGAYLVLVCVR